MQRSDFILTLFTLKDILTEFLTEISTNYKLKESEKSIFLLAKTYITFFLRNVFFT